MSETSSRILTLDILRGVALLGILIVNIAGFALPFDAMHNPTLGGVRSPADHLAWYVTDLFVSNSMRGLFSLLFGASIILLTKKREKKINRAAARTYFFRRNLWLMIFGLFHGYVMLMPGDILYYYAVTGFLLYFARNLSPGTLLTLALCIFGGRSAFESASYFSLQDLTRLAEAHGGIYLDLWRGLQQEYNVSPVDALAETDAILAGYGASFRLFAPFTFLMQTYVYITDMLWDVASMMLLGMALYKYGVLQGGCRRRFYVTMMVTGYLVGLSINALQLAHLQQENFNFLSQQRAMTTFDLCRLALTLGHVGLVNLLPSPHILPFLQKALAAVGRMALSNYLMQTLICIFLFNGFGFGLFNSLGRADLFGIVFGIWALQLTISPLWLKYHRFGPMEWLWRSLSFGEILPLRKTLPQAP